MLGTGALLLLAAAGIWWLVEKQRPTGTPEAQLQRMLAAAERAAESRDAAGVVRWISDDYQDSSGMNDERLRFQIGRWLRARRSIDILIPSQRVVAQTLPGGADARLHFPLTLNWDGSGGTGTSSMQITLHLRREKVFYYFLFPGDEWRVISAEGYIPLE